MSLTDTVVHLIQAVSLIVIVVICVCRLNALLPTSCHRLRLAYVVFAGGAFSLLCEFLFGGRPADPYLALFVLGIALSMSMDRRRSTCYDAKVAHHVG
jgi:hypothetical protein